MPEIVKTNSLNPSQMKKVLQANGYNLGDTVMARFCDDGKSHKGIIESHTDGWGIRVEKYGIRYSSLSSVSHVSYEESTASSSNSEPAVKGTEDMAHVVQSVVGIKSVPSPEAGGKPVNETVILQEPQVIVQGTGPEINLQEWIVRNVEKITKSGVTLGTIKVDRSVLPSS